VSEAWTIWGAANGVSDEAELLARSHSYRARTTGSTDPDPTIGCVILRNIFFAEKGEERPEPPHLARRNVTYTGYDLTHPDRRPDTDDVQLAFTALQHRARRPGVGSQTCAASPWNGRSPAMALLLSYDLELARVTSSGPSRQRIGTGALSHRPRPFRASKPRTSARCGGGVSMPSPTEHLLRTDVHRLYDRGYLSVDADPHVRVAPQLREHG